MTNDPGLTPPQAGARQSWVLHAIRWVFVSDYADRLRAEDCGSSPSTFDFRRRARLCLELADTVSEPPQAFDNGSALDVACDLYRQSVFWALRARASDSEAAHSSRSGGEEVPFDPSAVWSHVDPGLFSSSPLQDPAVLQQALSVRSFADFAEVPRERLSRMAEQLSSFARALTQRRLTPEGLWLRRLARGAVLTVAALALVACVMLIGSLRDRARDVARGKAWVASSRYGGLGCRSPSQSCPETSGYFFHTDEQEDPWLEIDLAQVERISAVQVESRLDCCEDRGVPLVVEVSKDHEHWSEVARREGEFTQWKAEFPAVDARWVKLHSPRRTMLHLNRVSVLR